MSRHDMPMAGHEGHDMSRHEVPTVGHQSHGIPESSVEKPISLESLDKPRHHIDRQLLVQDTHVHVPAYAMTAAFLAMIIFSLRLTSRTRAILILMAFAAPFADFLGLWGVHLWRGAGYAWAYLAIGGGFLMGVVYVAVLVSTLLQCWFQGQGEPHA